MRPPRVTFESPLVKSMGALVHPLKLPFESPLAKSMNALVHPPSPLAKSMDALIKRQDFASAVLKRPAVTFESQLAKSMNALLRPAAFQRAFAVDPALFRAAASVAHDLVAADGLDLGADAEAAGITWPVPSVDDLKTAQHVFWLAMIYAFAITLTVTDRVPDPVAMAWCGAAERTLAFAIFQLERYKG